MYIYIYIYMYVLCSNYIKYSVYLCANPWLIYESQDLTIENFTFGLQCVYILFSGGFAEFLKVTVSFIMSVRPSAWNNQATTEGILIKIEI
jgi:hypothetical protein